MADLTFRVLADINDRKVIRLAGNLFTVTDDTEVTEAEYPAYVEAVRQMLAASWVMESTRRRAGGRVLRLTSIGEAMHRHSDPTAFQSGHVFGVGADGRVVWS